MKRFSVAACFAICFSSQNADVESARETSISEKSAIVSEDQFPRNVSQPNQDLKRLPQSLQFDLADFEVGTITIAQPPAYKFVRSALRADVKRAVYARAHSRCENCGSQHALQIDHVLPVQLGGSNAPENLRLLCRNCNQRAAIDQFGQAKMDAHLGQSQSAWVI